MQLYLESQRIGALVYRCAGGCSVKRILGEFDAIWKWW